MATLSSGKAREKLSEVIDQVVYGKEWVTITRRGKPVAVLISLEDAEAIRAAEDQLDLEAVRKSKEETGFVSLEKAKRELGLL